MVCPTQDSLCETLPTEGVGAVAIVIDETINAVTKAKTVTQTKRTLIGKNATTTITADARNAGIKAKAIAEAKERQKITKKDPNAAQQQPTNQPPQIGMPTPFLKLLLRMQNAVASNGSTVPRATALSCATPARKYSYTNDVSYLKQKGTAACFAMDKPSPS